MIKLLAKSLGEVPEIMKPFCTEADGVVTFDESKIKTEQDVQNVKNAKDKEVNDHNTTKAELTKYKAIGKTPEELQNITDEYPTLKEGGKTNEEYLEEKRARAKAERERDDYKGKYESAKTEVDEYKGFKVKSLKDSKWKEVREQLAEKFDADKLDMLYEDIEDKLELDDIGEFKPYREKSVLEFFTNRADKMGWVKPNTPGGSSPGAKKIPPNLKTTQKPTGGEGILDDETTALLDS